MSWEQFGHAGSETDKCECLGMNWRGIGIWNRQVHRSDDWSEWANIDYCQIDAWKESHEGRSKSRHWSLRSKISEDRRCAWRWRLKLKWLLGWWNETEWNNWFWLSRWCGTDLHEDSRWLVKRKGSDDPVMRNGCEQDWKGDLDEINKIGLLWWLLIVRKESLSVRKDSVLSDLRSEWLVDGSKWTWQNERSFESFDWRLNFGSHCF